MLSLAAFMSFCTLFALGANVIVLGVILPEFLDHFQFSQAMLGILGSVKIAVFDICSGEFESLITIFNFEILIKKFKSDYLNFILQLGVMAGPLTQRYGCRPLAMCGLVLTTLSGIASSFVNDFYSLLITFSIIPGN